MVSFSFGFAISELCRYGKWHYLDTGNNVKRKIIHWVKEDSSEFKVYKPDGTTDKGYIESEALNAKGIIQFERYAFVNKTNDEFALYLHK